MFRIFFLGAALALLPIAATAQHAHDHGKEKAAAKKDDHSGHDHSGHSHAAPHGGTLVVLGDHGAHLELVHEPEEGLLTGYILDGHAANPVRIAQEQIKLQITGRGKERTTSFSLTLAAVASELTGEKKGDTSEFAGKAAELKKLKRFSATASEIDVRGQKHKKVKFDFPEGNE